MSRFVALSVTVALLVALFCCPPPAMAQQEPEQMVCPITQKKCETKADCDPPPPELLAAPSATPSALVPAVAVLPAAPSPAPPHELRPAVIDFWSAPTRTIVLRI